MPEGSLKALRTLAKGVNLGRTTDDAEEASATTGACGSRCSAAGVGTCAPSMGPWDIPLCDARERGESSAPVRRGDD